MRTAQHRRLSRQLAQMRRSTPGDGGELAALDEIVAFARTVDRPMLARALSVQADRRWELDDRYGAADASEEAVGLLEPLAARQPGQFGGDLLRARYVLAVALTSLGRVADAVPALERYVRMLRLAPVARQPNLTMAHRMLLDGYRELGRSADALRHAEVLARMARAAAWRPRISGINRFDLARALCVESDCRRVAGLPAVESAADAVAAVCREVADEVNGGTRALAEALTTLDDALGREHDPQLIEIGRWLTTRKPSTDFREWLDNVKADHERLAALLELAMRSFVGCGRDTDARQAGMVAVRLYRIRAREQPRCAAGLVRVQHHLDKMM